MKRLIAAIAGLCLLATSAIGFYQSRDSNYNIAIVSSGGGCSQATALIARMDGSQNTSAVTNFICGLVTDGLLSTLDVLYVPAINSTANANLNWISSSFSLSCTGSPTFTAGQGYTGNGTSFCSTTWVPSASAVNYTQNSATVGVCVFNSRTSGSSFSETGGIDAGGLFTNLDPLDFFGSQWNVNDAGFSFGLGATNAQGSWNAVRTASNAEAIFQNGTSIATSTQGSLTVPTVAMYILGYNNNGTLGQGSSDTLSAVWYGASWNTTQMGNFRSRLQTYMTAIGNSGC